MEKQHNIPVDYNGITVDWLTGVLSEKYKGTVVKSCHFGTVIHGTATKVRLLLDYNKAGHSQRLPPTMWVKGGFEPELGEDFGLKILYTSETCFYRDFADKLDIGCPKTYFTATDNSTKRSIILLEDLLAKNVTFGHCTNPISPQVLSRMLALLARLHAKYWKNMDILKAEWLQHGGIMKGELFRKLFGPENWDRCMALPRGKFVRGPLRDRKRTGSLVLKLLDHDWKNAHCLVHGDTHLGNAFFSPDMDPGYLDWQTVMWGYWAHDVTHLVTTAMTIRDRRHSERDLIKHYLDCLAENGAPAPGFEEAWLDYRRHAIYDFGWCVSLPEWQPEEVNVICTERACAAVLDLDTLNAW